MNGWSRRSIHDLCTTIVDCVNKTAPVVAVPTGYRMARTTNVKNGRVDLSSVRYVSEETYRRWTRRGPPQVGDILLTREAPLGQVGMIKDAAGLFLGQRLVLYRPDPQQSDGAFLLHAMRSDDVQSQIKAYGSGATVEHMRVPDCGALLINCPDVVHQRRIGAVLAAFDDLIEINDRRIELLEDLVESLYHEWFVRFRFPGYENVQFVDSVVGPLPRGWETRRLGDLARLAYGKSLPARTRRSGLVPVVSSAGIIGLHDEALVTGPGVVIGRKGNVGAVWWVDDDFFPIDTTYYVVSKQPLGLLYWQLRDLEFMDSHAAVPGLSREQANALPLLVPDERLALAFGAIHDQAFSMMATYRAHAGHLAATRDLLLPGLVSGRVDISDVDLGSLLPTDAT